MKGRSAAPQPSSESALGGSERAVLARSIDRVRASGQTRWIAQVVEGEVPDPVSCYARAGTADRFLWTRSEAGLSRVAVGVVDEVESAGAGRYRDVRDWLQAVRSRIDWMGAERSPREATFFGGFGFESTSRGAAEWKSFPAARFVLPELIAERAAEVGRWVHLVRVEAASTAESVEADLAARMALRDRLTRPVDEVLDAPEDCAALLEGTPGGWPEGPEFAVRSDRSHAIFRAQVRAALGAIEKGELTKLVLARSLTVDHDGPLAVPEFLERLRALYPTCTLIAVGRGQDTFLAATPETLIRVTGRAAETAALAGSAPRGRQPEEDRALAEGLLSSEKERAEHRHVVEAIRQVLEARCEGIEVPREPRLRPLFGIQHLETPIHGRLRGDAEETDILDLVDGLHPTPAVAGFPRRRAEDWLVEREGLDRGWYAAPIGWLDLEGGGDFCVALRSALIRNGLGETGTSGASRARLFAGAGIVTGSDPNQELVETRIKLRALLAPLTEI